MPVNNKRKFSGGNGEQMPPGRPDRSSFDNSEDDEDHFQDPLYIDETTVTMRAGGGMPSETESSITESESHQNPTSLLRPSPPGAKRSRKQMAKKTVQLPTSLPDDTFVTYYVDQERYQSRFLILPRERQAPSGKEDKLLGIIKRGGGIIVESSDEEVLREEEKKHLIKILDLDFIKSFIHRVGLQSIQLPYDCFSSSFIWSQYYCKTIDTVGLSSADLNLYRITPSAYQEYNANIVLKGGLNWDDIRPVPSDKLSPAVSIKQIALQLFPEALCSPSFRKRRIYTREESQHILNAVCQVDGFKKVHGVLLYKELSAGFSPTRSSASLREHFLKTILPHIVANDGYYRLAEEDGRRFRAALEEYDSRPKRGRKKKAQ